MSRGVTVRRGVAKSAWSQARRLAKDLGEVALARVADLRADLGDRQIAFGQQSSGPFDPQRSQVSVRRRAGDLFEQPREMKFAQISRSGDLGQAELASAVVAHKFNGPEQP